MRALYLDFSFSFHYLHSLKFPPDRLRIMLQNKSKKRTTREHRILGMVEIDMSRILQRQLDDELILYIPQKKRSKLKSEKKENNDKKDQEKMN